MILLTVDPRTGGLIRLRRSPQRLYQYLEVYAVGFYFNEPIGAPHHGEYHAVGICANNPLARWPEALALSVFHSVLDDGCLLFSCLELKLPVTFPMKGQQTALQHFQTYAALLFCWGVQRLALAL